MGRLLLPPDGAPGHGQEQPAYAGRSPSPLRVPHEYPTGVGADGGRRPVRVDGHRPRLAAAPGVRPGLGPGVGVPHPDDPVVPGRQEEPAGRVERIPSAAAATQRAMTFEKPTNGPVRCSGSFGQCPVQPPDHTSVPRLGAWYAPQPDSSRSSDPSAGPFGGRVAVGEPTSGHTDSRLHVITGSKRHAGICSVGGNASGRAAEVGVVGSRASASEIPNTPESFSNRSAKCWNSASSSPARLSANRVFFPESLVMPKTDESATTGSSATPKRERMASEK